MNINLNNYEAYFLDYHEDSLSPDLIKELIDFVALHPELKEEFENFEPVTLNELEGVIYENKEALKKHLNSINSSNFDEYAIGYVEGTLPTVLQQELVTFINQNTRFQKEIDLYIKTKLTPDTTIVFDEVKLSLKRNKRSRAVLYYWSAAASFAIIIVAYFMLNKNETPTGNIVVEHTPSVKDSNIVAARAIKTNDTSVVTPKSLSNTPVKNNPIAINATTKKQSKNRVIIQKNSTINSSIATTSRETNTIQLLTSILQEPIPVNMENTFVASSDNLQNPTFFNNWIMKYSLDNFNQQQADTIEISKEKSGSKVLYLLAKLTCKGLHKITGQHIKMEKKYDSDTTNIIAYQFDLGKKKFEFPVKE